MAKLIASILSLLHKYDPQWEIVLKLGLKWIGALFLLILLYLFFWPVAIDPVKWHAPEDAGYVGSFARNNQLSNLELLEIGIIHGPEDVAAQTTLEGLRLWVSSQEGKIVELTPSLNAVYQRADTGGVPLGIEFDAMGNLIIADAHKGLLSMSPDGSLTTLTNSVDDTPILYADDLDISPDGVIYFSDASTKFGAEAAGSTLKGSQLELLEHGRTGRVLAYDPQTRATSVIASELSFPNGVAMGPEGVSILVVETGEYRIHRIWISGPRKGQSDIIIDNLPGFPDNINRGPNGTYLIGLVSKRVAFLDDMSAKPALRKLALRLPEWVQPKPQNYGFVFQMDVTGTIVNTWQDPSGAYPLTTGAIITDDGYLYVSSLGAKKLGRKKLE